MHLLSYFDDFVGIRRVCKHWRAAATTYFCQEDTTGWFSNAELALIKTFNKSIGFVTPPREITDWMREVYGKIFPTISYPDYIWSKLAIDQRRLLNRRAAVVERWRHTIIFITVPKLDIKHPIFTTHLPEDEDDQFAVTGFRDVPATKVVL